MPKISPLPAERLHATFDPARVPWPDSRAIPVTKSGRSTHNPFQPRAMHALDLAMQINAPGYHVYLCGEPDLGRSHMLMSYLEPRAKAASVPPDLVYVHDFKNADAPRLMALPAGQGRKLKESIGELIKNIASDLERRFDTLNFVQQRASLLDQFQSRRSSLLAKMNSLAAKNGFNLDIDENGGMTLSPINKSKKNAGESSEELLENSAGKERHLAKNLMGFMRQLNKAEATLHDGERDLEHKAMEETLKSLFVPLEQKLLKSCPDDNLANYLSDLRTDILKNTAAFLPAENRPDGISHNYSINLFVDNSRLDGAPIIVEDNPVPANLLGCIERESEMGALVTDFTLLRAGSLHKANGGFLLIHVEDILQHPEAWEGLLRALRSNQARLEDWGDYHEAPIRTKGLRPEPLTLSVKVILIGGDDIFESLLYHEDRFPKLFRIKAHMTDSAERNAANIKSYLSQIARIIQESDLLPFNPEALAWLVDLGSHICEDQKRLSLKFPLLRELMIEATALAQMRSKDIVDSAILEDAYANKAYRANLVEEDFMEDYDREMIKVRTSGSAIGQVNGLSITSLGDFEFGLPHCISCTVGVGHEGIIDLEREAELGGPIHTKAMMILKSYLTDLFARKKPLVLSASLYFEQSYAGIEGDSASGAELAALLSAIAEVPVRLDLAFTGAVSHSGQIMAVGGVTRKIEGFYKVCARHGLTGTQGVIIPSDNVDHLMLSPEILASVESGKFSIYPARNIEEALELLTGMKSGKRHKDGTFTRGSLYDLVDRRLERLGCYAQNAFRKSRKE